jgi:hypothetical protein
VSIALTPFKEISMERELGIENIWGVNDIIFFYDCLLFEGIVWSNLAEFLANDSVALVVKVYKVCR